MGENANPSTTTTDRTIDADLNGRMTDLLTKLGSDAAAGIDMPDVPGGEEATEPTETPAKKEPAKAPTKDDPAVTEPAPPPEEVERKARLERTAALERESRAKHERVSTQERELKAEREAIKAERAELAKQLKSFDDAESLLGLLEKKVGHQRLGQWMIEQADPSKRAESVARKVSSEVDEKIKKVEEDNAKLRAELADRDNRVKAQAAREHATKGFTDRVSQVTSEAPFTARFIGKKPERAIQMASAIADEFSSAGKEFNYDDVIIRMETILKEDADIYADPQQAGSDLNTSDDKHSTKTAAAKAPTTVTNRAAATRTSIVDDDEASLSLEERTRRTERRLRAVK